MFTKCVVVFGQPFGEVGTLQLLSVQEVKAPYGSSSKKSLPHLQCVAEWEELLHCCHLMALLTHVYFMLANFLPC